MGCKHLSCQHPRPGKPHGYGASKALVAQIRGIVPLTMRDEQSLCVLVWMEDWTAEQYKKE